MNPQQAKQACYQILEAYARGELSEGSVDWDDLDQAFEFAKSALPGEYQRIVRELEQETEDAFRERYRR